MKKTITLLVTLSCLLLLGACQTYHYGHEYVRTPTVVQPVPSSGAYYSQPSSTAYYGPTATAPVPTAQGSGAYYAR